MKFTFPFVCTEPDGDGSRMTHDMISIHVRSDSTARYIKKAIRKVIKQEYGIVLSSEESQVYYDAGNSMVRTSNEAEKNASTDNIKLGEDDMRKFISRRQAIASERLKKEK